MYFYSSHSGTLTTMMSKFAPGTLVFCVEQCRLLVAFPLFAVRILTFRQIYRQEWLELGKVADQEENGTVAVPAFICQSFSLSGGPMVKFVEGTVVGYDQDTDMYRLRIGEESKELLRPRVLVMFKADDPFIFAKRVAAALHLRDQTTRELVYNLSLDCMPVDFLPAMAHQQVQRIMSKAVTTKRLLAAHPDALKGTLSGGADAIVEEMNLEYLRALNKCILDQTHSQNMMLPAQEQNKTLSAISCPASSWGPVRSGCVAMPQDYGDSRLQS